MNVPVQLFRCMQRVATVNYVFFEGAGQIDMKFECEYLPLYNLYITNGDFSKEPLCPVHAKPFYG